MCRRGGLKGGCEGNRRFQDADVNLSLEPTTHGNRRFAEVVQRVEI